MAPRQLLVRLAAGPVLALLLSGAPSEAAGPWKGQIVDRDTGQPIPGAVVLAIWTVRSRDHIHPEDEFHSAVEVVSDEEGRFVIPEHTAMPTKPLTQMRGPELVVFKGGYGGWAFQGGPYYPYTERTRARTERIEEAWRHFEQDGVVIELRKVTDRQQRLNRNSSVRPSPVPSGQMPRLLKALDEERTDLGVPPYHVPLEKR